MRIRRPDTCAANASARAASSGVLTLKNGSIGSAGQSAMATPCRAVQISILRRSSSTRARRKSSRSATATARRPGDAIRRSARRRAAVPAATRASCRRATRFCGRNGQSPGTLASHSICGAFAAAQSRPARMPASGPAKSGTLSATTGRPVSAKRAGSPLALMMRRSHCGDRHASTRSRMVRPPIAMRALSPPPMRRARPPASTRPRVGGPLTRACHSSVTHRAPRPCADAWRFLPRHKRGPGRTRCGPRRRARRSACRGRGRSASGSPCARARRPRR